MFRVTNEWLLENRTKRGGYTKNQLNLLGIEWPPIADWKISIIDKDVDIIKAKEFEKIANKTKENEIAVLSMNTKTKPCEDSNKRPNEEIQEYDCVSKEETEKIIVSMENQDDFKYAGTPWGFEEDQLLIKEYTVDNLNLLKICEIHKRKPGGIISRLKQLNLIDIRQNTRGYSEYLKSDLYKELQAKKRELEHNAIVSDEHISAVKNNQNEEKKIGMFGLDKSLYPSRMGKAWDEEEVIKLLKLVQQKKSIKEISEVHQRTEGGIRAKLKGLAADYYIYNNKTVDEIEKYTGLSKEVILEAIQKKQYRDSLKKEKKIITASESYEPSLNELMTVMKDIQHKMNVILEKIQ